LDLLGRSDVTITARCLQDAGDVLHARDDNDVRDFIGDADSLDAGSSRPTEMKIET
jgi:hypothetical protein